LVDHALLSSKNSTFERFSDKSSELVSFILAKLLDAHILLEEDIACVMGEPNSCFDCVKLKLSFMSFSLMGDILRSHLVWLANERFSVIAVV
jgi:hypothetical protein